MKPNVIFIFITFLLSCNHNQAHKIKYSDLKVDSIPLTGQVLNNSFIFSWPDDILIVDSVLVIHDSFKQDSSFHVFHRHSGKHIKSFGYKGRGPGEVLFPPSIHYNPHDHTITTFEPNLRKIIKYNLRNILQNTNPKFQEQIITASKHHILQIIPYKNIYMLRENNLNTRFSILQTNDSITVLYGEYPQITTDPEENSAIFNYTPRWAIRPDQKKMVNATYIGSIIEIFDIRNDIKPETTTYFYPPVFRPFEGTKPKWIATTPETIIGTDNLYCTNNYIYMIFQGKVSKHVEKKKIIVLDWQGNPKIQYNLKNGIPHAIAVDENEKTIYCVITNSKEEYVLSKYTY